MILHRFDHIVRLRDRRLEAPAGSNLEAATGNYMLIERKPGEARKGEVTMRDNLTWAAFQAAR